jgi:hypothetical protein
MRAIISELPQFSCLSFLGLVFGSSDTPALSATSADRHLVND